MKGARLLHRRTTNGLVSDRAIGSLNGKRKPETFFHQPYIAGPEFFCHGPFPLPPLNFFAIVSYLARPCSPLLTIESADRVHRWHRQSFSPSHVSRVWVRQQSSTAGSLVRFHIRQQQERCQHAQECQITGRQPESLYFQRCRYC